MLNTMPNYTTVTVSRFGVRHMTNLNLTDFILSIFSPTVITFLGEWWGQTNLYLYGKPEDIRMISKEKSLTVINHYGDVDWLTCWVFAERLGFLGVRFDLFILFQARPPSPM